MKKILSAIVLSTFVISVPVIACEMNQASEVKAKFSSAMNNHKISLKSGKAFSVKGMTCQSCVNKVTDSIKKVNGVKTVMVDLKTKKATVVYADNVKETKVASEIVKAVTKAGFTASKI